MVLAGPGRSLTIKQFLFDFAPPAYDHPSLWRNPKKTKEAEFPVPKAYPLRDNILWIGHDHRRLPAATIGFHRVRVEATIRGGKFSNQELFSIFEKLVPVDKDYAATLRATPFSILAYQSRHKQKASDVPLSYWTHKRNPKDYHSSKIASPQQLLSHLSIPAPDLTDLAYSLDSFFVIAPENGPSSEVDLVYEAKEKNGAYLRLLISPTGSPSPIVLPPSKYTQECSIDSFEIGHHHIKTAWLTQDYGPYEAAFLYKGHRALLLAQPAIWTDGEWFRELLQHIMQET